MGSIEKSDSGAETIPVNSRHDTGDVEVELTGMKRPICGMQGQEIADESLIGEW